MGVFLKMAAVALGLVLAGCSPGLMQSYSIQADAPPVQASAGYSITCQKTCWGLFPNSTAGNSGGGDNGYYVALAGLGFGQNQVIQSPIADVCSYRVVTFGNLRPEGVLFGGPDGGMYSAILMPDPRGQVDGAWLFEVARQCGHLDMDNVKRGGTGNFYDAYAEADADAYACRSVMRAYGRDGAWMVNSWLARNPGREQNLRRCRYY